MGLNTAFPGRRRVAALRRGLSVCGVAAAAVALAPGAASAASTAGLGSAWTFKTQPKLMPPKLTVTTNQAGTAPGLIFLDPFKDFASANPQVGQSGALIYDRAGNPVWFKPATGSNTTLDFRVQSLHNQPVLTAFQGQLVVPGDGLTNVPIGYTEPGAVDQIYNDHYQLMKTVAAQAPWTTVDPREFFITPQGDAIYIVDRIVNGVDLTAYGGPANGSVEDNGIQEVDLKTGKVIFDWNMMDHVPLSQSTLSAKFGIFDPFHINSIVQGPNGDLLLSARNTSSLYDINGTSGAVNWTLDAKPNATDSSFTLGPNAAFAFQHDAQFLPNGDISLFDDHCCANPTMLPTPPPVARALVLNVNTTNHTATYVSSITHTPGLTVATQGNSEPLSNGNTFVGWGQAPYFSEYSSSGQVLYDAMLPAADESYRTYRFSWDGKPLVKPRISVTKKGRNATIAVSWNGTTETASWEVLVGTGKQQLKVVKQAIKRGFETTVHVRAKGSYYEVKALNAKGHVLRASAITHR